MEELVIAVWEVMVFKAFMDAITLHSIEDMGTSNQ